MLNIISKSIISKHNRGPRKVVLNTIKGLDLLGYPYQVNAALDSTKQLWIHDDPEALKAANKLPPHIKIVAGPNAYTTPSELPTDLSTQIVWLHPSLWVQGFWNTFGGKHMTSVVWPSGVDTEEFKPENNLKDIVLIYNKQRSDIEVERVCEALAALKQDYQVITYGTYHEDEYLKLLGHSKAIVWIGRSESQGIGLIEALAMDVPALVFDVTHFGQWNGSGKERFTAEQLKHSPVTAAPYFNDSCGVVTTDIKNIYPQLEKFLQSLENFSPREFVEKNLSLQKQASALLDIYRENYGVTEDELRDTHLENKRKWKNASLAFKILINIKDAVRRLIR